MSDASFRRRVLDAHGDAWQAEGLARAPYGGGAVEVRGARLMASGIATPKWNNADITDRDVDVEAMSAWYASRRMPWGLRVPLGIDLEIGTPLFEKRSFGLERGGLSTVAPPPGFIARRAAASDLARFAAAESTAFGDDLATTRRWLDPVFGIAGFEHWLAIDAAGETAAVASLVRSHARAGAAAMLTGAAAIGAGRDASLQAWIASEVLAAAFADGIQLAHAHGAFDVEAANWLRLGFTEVPGFLIRVVRNHP